MKRWIMLLFLLANIVSIIYFLINFESAFNPLWMAFFILGLVLSIVFMKERGRRALPFSVLVTSLSLLGAFAFNYFLSHLMG
ncbi:hypothetical protein [Fictibacillus fluitans]|uniref:DUF3953 domain-containing protein n=1 Tax=Fictibacillus fluitans TaxID=3058422 RepID=A0ABT8HTL7_9BACL|nr:hypothetical protein [Fictibacillus sp. NE201]MDN4524122.1 hypothetical protein [Fictibacillus sp. NE201]